MPSLLPSWDLVPVLGRWLTPDLQHLSGGSYKVEIPRATSADGSTIVTGGVYDSGTLQVADSEKLSLDVKVPLPGDPDLSEVVKVIVTVIPTGKSPETYVLSGPAPEGGYVLGKMVPTSGAVSVPPSSLKIGLPGGVPRLNADGNVLDAAGNVISGGGDLDETALDSRNLSSLRDLAGLAASLATVDSAPVDWYVLGDSLTEGMGATRIGKTWPYVARDQLRALYPVAPGGPNYVPVFFDSSSLPSPWTLSSGVTPSHGVGLGQRYVILDGSKSATLSFTGTRAVLHTVNGDGIGFGTYSVDGGPAVQFGPAAGPFASTGRVVIDVPLGSHKVVVKWAAGNGVYLEGAAVHNGDEAKGLRVWNGSAFGSSAKSWAAWAAEFPYFDNRLAQIAPKLVTIALGLNDIGDGVSLDDFRAAYAALVNRVTAASPGVTVQCVIPPVSRVALKGRTLAAPVEDYWSVIRELAATRSHVFVTDTSAWFPELPADGTDPFDLWATDETHLTDRGYALLGSGIAKALSAALRVAGPTGIAREDIGRTVASLGADGRLPDSQIATSTLDRIAALEDAPPPDLPPAGAITAVFEWRGSELSPGTATQVFEVPFDGTISTGPLIQLDDSGIDTTVLTIERLDVGAGTWTDLYGSGGKPTVPAGSVLYKAAAPNVQSCNALDLVRLRLLKTPPAPVAAATAVSIPLTPEAYGDNATDKTVKTHTVPMPTGEPGDVVLLATANGVFTSLPSGWESISTVNTTPNGRINFSLVAAPWSASMPNSFTLSSSNALVGATVLLRKTSVAALKGAQFVTSDGVEQVGAGAFGTPVFTASKDADVAVVFAATHFAPAVDGYRQEWGAGGPTGTTKRVGALTALGSTSYDWGFAVGTSSTPIAKGASIPSLPITLTGGVGSNANTSNLTGVLLVPRAPGVRGPVSATVQLTIKAA